MTMFLTIAVIVLIFVIIFQIAKASEYVSVIKGEEEARKQNNKINGFLMLGFMIIGLIGVWYCNDLYFKKTLLAYPAASDHGEKVDSMLWLTLVVTGVVFIATQILLFWFAFKYQESDKRKVYFLAHNNKLELLWTVVPAIFLTVLVVIGLRNWFSFTGEAPANAMQIEVTGKQFGWIFRYPGHDKQFGKKYYRLIDAADNSLGLVWRDTTITMPSGAPQEMKDDPYTHDDIVVEQTMYLVKKTPVKLIIGSRDVIHDVGLSQFRQKMDAVPGIPTTMWFTPLYTTKEMKDITGNPNFEYEISCDQMCGNGHYSMKGIIKVVTQEEYDAWMATQKPKYVSVFPPPAADTTGVSAKPIKDTTKAVAKK
jgi:cytochrome c oxidase subunit 2